MMRDPQFPSRKSNHCTGRIMMIRSIIAVSLIRITFGRFLPTDEAIGQKMTEVGHSDTLPAWIQHAERLWGWENGGKQPDKEIMPHSRISDLTSLSGGETRVNGDFESKEGQKFLDSTPGKGRKPVTLVTSKKDQFKLIIQQYKTLKNDSVRWSRDTSQITISGGKKNAYQVLQKIYEDILSQLQIWYRKRSLKDSEELVSLFDICNEIEWKIMAAAFKESLNDCEDLLAHRDMPTNVSVAVYYHDLEVQVFKILNFLLENKLVETDSVKDWVNRDILLKAIQNHIIEMCTPANFFAPDLVESLQRSESTKHLGSILDFFTEEFWKCIEFRSFDRRLFENVGLKERCGTRLNILIEDFKKAKFGETVSEPSQKMKEVVKKLVEYFDSYEANEVGTWSVFDQAGMLYEMIYLVMKYHTKTLLGHFKKKSASYIFLQKIKIINYAIYWLKSSRERTLVARFGFWTTEGDFKKSKKLISLGDAQYWSNFPVNPDQYLKDNFSLDIQWDYSEWIMRFKKSAAKKQNGLWRLAKLVPESISYGTLSLEPITSTSIKSENAPKSLMTSSDKFISKSFLEEAYTWCMNLQLLQKRFLEEEEQYLNNINRIAFCGEDLVSNHLKVWLHRSLIMISLRLKIFNHARGSRDSWNILKLKLEQLNLEALHARSKMKGKISLERNSFGDDSSSSEKQSEDAKSRISHVSIPGFYIPTISIETKA